MARLKDTYKSEIAPALMSKFGYKSVMQIPKLEKIVINCGCSELRENPKVLDSIMGDLMKITGQRPVATKARKSVANFKLREGMVIGAKVTAENLGTGEVLVTQTDEFGDFWLHQVGAAEWRVYVEAQGYMTRAVEASTKDEDRNMGPIEVFAA